MSFRSKGSQFQTLYRGITDESGTGVGRQNLGVHWSTDRSVAESFASFDTEGYAVPGHVITAQVHSRHIVQPGSLERRRMMASHGVHGEGSAEYEMPVRPGGIVHVRSVESLSEDGSADSWPAERVAGVFGHRRVGRA